MTDFEYLTELSKAYNQEIPEIRKVRERLILIANKIKLLEELQNDYFEIDPRTNKLIIKNKKGKVIGAQG